MRASPLASAGAFLLCFSVGLSVSLSADSAAEVTNSEQELQARQLLDSGRFDEAKQRYQVIVKTDTETLGEQNPKTLTDRVALATARSKTGDSLEAEEELRTVLAINVRRRGPDHDETLACRTALARLLDDSGRTSEAIREYRTILDSRERTLGAEDLQVARVKHSLADALVAQRAYDDAIPLYRAAQTVLMRGVGADDRETLLNRSNLACAVGEKGDFETAETELKEILAARERLFGTDDISVYTTCFYLARVLAGHGHLDESNGFAERALKGFRLHLPANHALTVRATHLCAELKADIANQAKKTEEDSRR
jgi:tetratricopeptide (TPR) repeat protein